MKTRWWKSREIEQWFLKTTAYAEQLLDDLKTLEGGWPERVITMQRNWIGKSVGARVKFAVRGCGGRGADRDFHDAHRYDLWSFGDYSGGGASAGGEAD